jgi:hypothetical protein
MSVQITEAMVQQYRSTVYHLSQQKGSKLRRAVRVETVTGKNAFFDQIGATAAALRTSRHADTPRMDTPHNRRRVSIADYDWADLIDNEDQIRLLMDPASAYAEAAAMAMGRSMDDVIIAAVTATAYTGETGSTSTSYDTGMDVPVTTRWPGVSSADCGLNVAKLIEARRLLGVGNVDPDEPKWLVVNSRGIASLMKDTRVNSHDYNTLKPLASGQIVQYYGFNFLPTERTVDSTAGTIDGLPYWSGTQANSGMLLAIGKDIGGRISERADKNYATQVFSTMTIGATRMEEAKVGRILCDKDGGPEGDLD